MRWWAVPVAVVLVAACRAGASDSGPAATTGMAATTGLAVTRPTAAPATLASVATTTIPTIATTTSGPAPATTVPAAGLDGISLTAVPSDVIVPTSPASLDDVTNPINGRRSEQRPAPGALDCIVTDPSSARPCLARTLDRLGFDVAGAADGVSAHRVERATAVVQLDAGLSVTGAADDALAEYLGITADSTWAARAREVRQIGTSQQGRPITAVRYGDGRRTVLVVGQTHGDEEGGLRVLLRARSLALPNGVTLWVIPTMNPDGAVLDTRFLADGADPNRRSPSQPEQEAVQDFALAVRPALTVWYHQNYGWVGGSGASMAPARRYQELTGLGTLKRSGDCAAGFVWCPIDDAVASSSILVELPDVLTPADTRLHARALLAVVAGDDGS